MKRLFLVMAVALLSTVTMYGQSKMSNYTVLLLDSKKSETVADFKNNPMAKTIMNVNGKEYVDCYVHFVGQIDEDVLAQYGVQLHCRYDFINVATAAVPVDAIEALAEDSRIKYVEAGKPVRAEMNDARKVSHADEVLEGLAPLTKSYLGRGVVVGVVDGDMQYDHPAFWNAAHNRFRLTHVWNQNKYGGTAPQGFDYGSEYKDSATIMTQKYDTRQMTSGHATHVAGIAVGADHSTNYYGIAQESEILFVASDNTTETGIPDGIKYCFDYAQSVGKPCVVNVSMGSTVGPHDGTSTESKIIDGLVGKGLIAVGSAGNSGDTKIHVGKTLNGTDTTFATFVTSKSMGGIYKGYAYIDVFGDINQVYTIQFFAYNKDSKSYAFLSTPIASNSTKQSSSRLDTVIGTYGRLKCNMKMVPSVTENGRGHITINFISIDSIPYRHNIGLRIVSHDSGQVNMWSIEDYSEFTNANQKNFEDGNSDYTVSEPMGVTEGVISVGSYTSYSKYKSAVFQNISSFSSKGPTSDNRIKPDIAAPGELIMSAYPDITGIKDGRSVTTKVGGTEYYYGLMQGTSMSSPYCAGVIATWLEANPDLTPDDIRDVFRHTSILDNYTGDASTKPDNTWGLGKLNAYQGILYILGLTTKVQDVATTGVLVAYPNPTSDILNIGFPVADENVNVAIYDLSGKCVYSENLNETTAGQSLQVSVESLTTGAYIVKVAGQKMNDTFKLLKQ